MYLHNLLVIFFNKAVEIPAKSLEMGRRYCVNQVWVKIQHPGENFNIIEREATDQDKMRFRNYWSAFVQNRTQVPEGSPIDLLFPNHPAVGENLRAMGIFTIEQCAKLSANAIDNIGRGGQEYVNRAQAYLSQADKGKNFHKLQKQLDDARTENRVLSHQVGQLKETVDKLMLRGSPGESINPPWIQGFDAQAERINANHPTKELAAKGRKKNKAKPVEVEPYDPITDPLASMKPGNDLEDNPDIASTQGQD